jgi:hydrogenase nickel incorporation protein HypB
MHEIVIEENLFAKNDAIAKENREYFKRKGIFVVNLVSSPGSGKTTLIEKTLEQTGHSFNVAVIEGDIQTDNDAQRIAQFGIPVKQITTGRACHLDAHLIQHTFDWLDSINGLELLIIENVGNLVCPSDFDLGEDYMVSILSTTEGEDKPLKYPFIFRKSEALIINKTDLLPYTSFDINRVKENARSVNPYLTFFDLSCTTGKGMAEWIGWLKDGLTAKNNKLPA